MNCSCQFFSLDVILTLSLLNSDPISTYFFILSGNLTSTKPLHGCFMMHLNCFLQTISTEKQQWLPLSELLTKSERTLLTRYTDKLEIVIQTFWTALQGIGAAPADRPLEMEAEKEGLSHEEGSSQKEWKPWKDLFRTCPEARGIILDRMDLETALACRLVCKDWRYTINNYKKLWAEINQVFSKANYLEYLKRGCAWKYLSNCKL